MGTILDTIVATKREEVQAAMRRQSLEQVQAAAAQAEPVRDFFAAVTAVALDGPQLIAEIKKASPSAGLIREDFDPASIAEIYARHGAAALSVLTDETYFQGRLEYIALVKRAVSLPVLRKDFMLEAFQLFESRAAGADAVLFIVEAIGAERIAELLPTCRELDMTALIEVHREASLCALLDAVGPPGPDRYLLGINNRDLTVQRTDLATTSRLARLVPEGSPIVSESGLATREHVLTASRAGACAILVGESLLREAAIGAKVEELLGRR